jgi:DNA-binding response OmpR family regulator
VKILIAEDDKDTREGLRELLAGEGFQVTAAADGRSAVRLFAEEGADLVCLDIMMPGLSGYEACREIRKSDTRVPILFLSARAEEIDKVLGLELGADDYVVKPFGVREILARVKALLRRNAPPAAEKRREPFAMGALTVLPAELRARRNGTTVDLTEREAVILETLYRNRGRVVSRQELFDTAWGTDYLPSSRTLDQTISQLRKKIGGGPAEPEIIETVHAAGYRWEG